MNRLLRYLIPLGGVLLALLALYPIVSSGHAVAAPAGTAAAGKAYWDASTTWCSRCHGVNGEGAYGPDLAGRGLSFEQFARAVRKPWGVMPAFTERQASDQNIADMAAYFNSLPKNMEPGPWRTQVPAGAPLGQRLLIETAGCGQCHGAELGNPRRSAGAEGGDFAWLEELVYEHTNEFPTGRMGNFQRARLPEETLRAIWQYMSVDVGLRVPVTAVLSGTVAGDNTTYTLKVSNTGTAGKGLAAGDIYISMRVPAGSSVASTSTTGYQGTQKSPDGSDIAVWLARSIAAGDQATFTLTVSGSGARSGSQGFVRWLSPTRGGEYIQTVVVRP